MSRDNDPHAELALTKEHLAMLCNDTSSATLKNVALPPSSTETLATAGWGRKTKPSIASTGHSIVAGWGRKTNPSVCTEAPEAGASHVSKL